MPSLRADDKLLFLGVPGHAELASIGRILISGCAVALGTKDEVDQARSQFSEFDNLMFVEADLTRIPWGDHFFTKVIVASHLEPIAASLARELERVLAPGGCVERNTQNG
jgi:hypothetical protein